MTAFLVLLDPLFAVPTALMAVFIVALVVVLVLRARNASAHPEDLAAHR